MASTAKHDWPMVRLGDVCEISAGGTPKRSVPSYFNGEIPWVKIGDMEASPLVTCTEETITHLGLKESPAKLWPAGTILLSIFATVGRVAVLGVEAASNQAIAGLQVVDERVDRQYLVHYLRSLENELKHKGRGVAQNNVNLRLLRELEIPVPPLDEQRRIAAILDQASEVMSKLEKQLRLLERQDVKVVEKFLASADYPFKALSDVCEVNPVTRFPTGISEEIPFIPMGAVSESGVLAFTEWRRMDEVRSGYTRFRKHDVLIAKITPCYENGKSAVATIDADFAAGSTEFHVFRCDANLDPRFLHAVLNSTVVRTTGIANMRGSSGHRRVPAWVFENLRIPLPPIVTQEKLMDSIDEVVEVKSRSVQKQLRSSIELSQSLSTRAFQGEL